MKWFPQGCISCTYKLLDLNKSNDTKRDDVGTEAVSIGKLLFGVWTFQSSRLRRHHSWKMIMSMHVHHVGYLSLLFLMLFFWAGLPDINSSSEISFIQPSRVLHVANRWELNKNYDSLCSGKKVYMYNLPPQFNKALEDKCDNRIISWLNLCPHFENSGYGKQLENMPEWYGTDAYMLEVIFHNRMETYPCRTHDPAKADAFFVPYYSGLDALPFLYNKSAIMKERRAHGLDLVDWLENNAMKWWARHGGKDHFMVMGRTTWDFRLTLDNVDESAWGTSLHALPQIQNMTSLLLETNPWDVRGNEQAIPYPTSFHPSSPKALNDWIEQVRSATKRYLFAFVGAPRPGMATSIRGILFDQCTAAGLKCLALDCAKMKCSHNPEPIVKSLLTAEFCLQPPGDTSTRRSTFDSIISGCIPVFFHDDSAYSQYTWHLPDDHDSYSIFIPEKSLGDGVKVVDVLSAIPKEKIQAMRETLTSLIPNIIYMNYANNPNSAVKDAFELTLSGIINKISSLKP